MIRFSSKYRSEEIEIMDDFELRGAQMKSLLTDLKRVNTLLGGKAVTLNGIKKLLIDQPNNDSVTILDIGCGDGEMLRQCAGWAKRQGRKVRLVGIDGNAHILQEAEKRSSDLKNGTFKLMDVFAENRQFPTFDIALCTLFLHHFKEPKILELMQEVSKQAKVGVVINDLHRNIWAFWLFRIFSLLFLRTKIARHDGLVSVARGFKKTDLKRLAEKIEGNHSIKWKWAFRYQWIVQK